MAASEGSETRVGNPAEWMPKGVDSLVVFDDLRGSFGPLTDLRAAFELRAGLGTLLERLEAACGRRADRLDCDPRVAAVVAERTGRSVNTGGQGTCLVVNGRLASTSVLRMLSSASVLVDASGALVAAIVPADRLGGLHASGFAASDLGPTTTVDAELVATPWAIAARIATTLAEDIEHLHDGSERRHLSPNEGQSFGTHPILIHPSATLGPTCVIDASKGAVVVGPHAVVRPFAVLVGPCAILDASTVAERSLIKASTVIGPHCRAGGEIGGTIFQAYSNKSHDGHLGDSFVGEWVNIGAGTDNSNLLNTYGEVIVRLEPDGGLVRTGRQFWGTIIGDHVKLAIGTRLMTGTTIGTGAMIAQSRPPSSLVPRFGWLVDGADSARTFRLDKFMETARAMMSRRGHSPSAALEQAIGALHAKSTGTG